MKRLSLYVHEIINKYSLSNHHNSAAISECGKILLEAGAKDIYAASAAIAD